MEFGLIKTGIRAFQVLCCILGTAMIGNIIASEVNAAGSANAAINFSMFVLVVSWLAALYGLATRLKSGLEIPAAIIGLDGAAVLFTFIAAVVLAAKLGAVNCGSIDHDSKPGDYIAWGSNDDEKRCREIQAGDVFLWFLFASFAATLFFGIKDSRRNFGNSTIGRSSMAQIRV